MTTCALGMDIYVHQAKTCWAAVYLVYAIVVVDAFHPPPTRLTFFNQAAKFASLQNTDSTRLLTLVAFQYAKDGRMTHVIAAAARRRHSLHRILLP